MLARSLLVLPLVFPAFTLADTLTSDPFTMTFIVGNPTLPTGYTPPGTAIAYPTHVDIGFPVVDEGSGLEFEPHFHDETNNAEYGPDEAHMVLNYTANRPAGSQWDFIGVGAGDLFYYIDPTPPNSSNQYPYLGWATEESQDVINANGLEAWLTGDSRAPGSGFWHKLSLLDVTGADGAVAPGDLSVWTTSFGTPIPWFSTFDGGITDADALFIQGATHAHYGVGFSDPGVYEITFQGQTQVVPEPASFAAIGLGMMALLKRRRRA